MGKALPFLGTALVLILITCQPALPPGTPGVTPGVTLKTLTAVTNQLFPQEITVGFCKDFDPALLWLPRAPEPFSPLDLAFESLLSLSSDRRLEPGLAQFEVSSDGTAITFKLSSQNFWHSGEPLTAYDAATFLESAFSPERRGPLSSKANLLKGIKVHDERTFTVTLNEPDCSLITEMGLLKLTRPPAFLRPLYPEKLAGTGPYRVIQWSRDEILLEKSITSPKQRAPFHRVLFRRFDSTESLFRALREGEIAVFILDPGESAIMEGISTVKFPSSELYFLAFNLREPILKDVRVRKALGMAIPREELLEEVLGGEGILAKSPFLPGYLAEEPALPPFNPERAKNMLRENGWIDEDGDGILDKEGSPFKLRILTNGENRLRENVALRITKYYRAIGIDAELNVVEWGNFLETLFGGYFQIAVFSIPIGPDPDLTSFFSARGIFNFSGFSDPEVEKLLKQAVQLPGCEFQSRRRIYSYLALNLAELRPWDYLFFPYIRLGPKEVIEMEPASS
ncbi:MAG: ABC transporter substrate-binding protein [Anaerolineae bacterium]|nr:ABC transporter substrate-binding protein [Anaerolineae bacterium]